MASLGGFWTVAKEREAAAAGAAAALDAVAPAVARRADERTSEAGKGSVCVSRRVWYL